MSSGSITGGDQWVEHSISDLNKLHHMQISIWGTFSATVTVQLKRPDESTYRDLYDADGEIEAFTAPFEGVMDLMGAWDVRAGCKSGEYTSGTVEIRWR